MAFLIAASAMFESRGLPIPLVRIGTGAAGLILQTIPFMLVGAMMSQRSAHSSAPMRGAARAEIAGRRTGDGDESAGCACRYAICMVVPTFANLVRKRLPLPYATALLCAAR